MSMKKTTMKWTLAALAILITGVLISCGGDPESKAVADATDAVNNVIVETMPARELSSSEIDWLPLDEGLKYAKAENLPILVDFTASWCTWCKKMDRDTFTSAEVIVLVNSNFVPVRVWGDSDDELTINGVTLSEKQFTVQAGVRGFPTFTVFDSELAKLHNFSGYKTPSGFLAELSRVQLP